MTTDREREATSKSLTLINVGQWEAAQKRIAELERENEELRKEIALWRAEVFRIMPPADLQCQEGDHRDGDGHKA